MAREHPPITVSLVELEGQKHVRADVNPAPGPPLFLEPGDTVTWFCDPSVGKTDLRVEFDGFFDLSANGTEGQTLTRVSSALRNGPFASLDVDVVARTIVGRVFSDESNSQRVLRWNYHFFDGATGLQIPWDTSEGRPNSGGVDKPTPPPSSS